MYEMGRKSSAVLLPALRAEDLDEALASLVPGRPAYVADVEGTGTTLYTAPYDEFDPSFGPDSAHAHLVGGAHAVEGELTSLRRDVDDLDDLRAAQALGLGPQTDRLVAGLPLCACLIVQPLSVSAAFVQ